MLTTLTKEAMPLLRYRTRDITSILDGKCDCGRTHTRISWITGRSDDMLKIKGVNVFPSQIETAVMRVKGVGTNYQIEVTRKGFMDDITVSVEVDRTISHDTRSWPLLKEKVREEIESIIGTGVGVNLRPPDSLPRVEGKATRVVDLRV